MVRYEHATTLYAIAHISFLCRDVVQAFDAPSRQASRLRSVSRSLHLPSPVESEPTGYRCPTEVANRIMDESLAHQTKQVQVSDWVSTHFWGVSHVRGLLQRYRLITRPRSQTRSCVWHTSWYHLRQYILVILSYSRTVCLTSSPSCSVSRLLL